MDIQKTDSKKILSIALLLLVTCIAYAQQTVRYDLYVKDTLVNYTGKIKKAIAVNGQIPMPTLSFAEGDTALIYVHNELNESTSLHWHGLFLPNKEDGVPYLTQMPIPPKSTYVYKFPITQNGTHWYHSHSDFQEQIGMYGALILNKRKNDTTFRKGIDDLPTIPIILSEWTDYKPSTVHRMLHNASDWFAIKKGSTQSYAEAIREGFFKTKLKNEWKRLLAMDVSDVYYDKFLINGKNAQQLSFLKGGEKVRLRIANGGASTYFWLTYSSGKITVVANDGNDVQPVEVDRLIIAASETYDIIVTMPTKNTAYELLATSEDRIGSASLWLGKGIKLPARPLPKLKYFEGMKMMNGMMRGNGILDAMGMEMSLQEMDMNVVMYPEITGYSKRKDAAIIKDMETADSVKDTNELSQIVTLNYGMLQSPTLTTLPKLKYFEGMKMMNGMMKGNGTLDAMGMEMSLQEMDMNVVMYPEITGYSKRKDAAIIKDMETADSVKDTNELSQIVTLNYGMLQSPTLTTLPKNAPVKEIFFTLTGNMNRYVWSLNNKVISETTKILIKKGENLRLILYNESMMRHPMHLHGHDFRVLNKYGANAPLKNVLDIMPMETDTIEFNANAAGDWFFHCHILYHMMSGMGRVFSYENQPANPYIANPKWAYRKFLADDKKLTAFAKNNFATNGNFGMLMAHNTRWSLSADWQLGYNRTHGYEVETYIRRYVDKMQWLSVFVGFDWKYRKLAYEHMMEKNMWGQLNRKENRAVLTAGFTYVLPILIQFQAKIASDGNILLRLMREDIPLSRRLRLDFMVNSNKEYMIGLRYIVDKNIGIATHYDKHMGWGLGIAWNY